MKATRIFYTIAPVVGTAMLAVLMMIGCRDQENAAIAESNSREIAAIPVSVTVVEPVSIRDVVFLPGETEAYEDVMVAANTSGQVEWLGPAEGQEVKKGELLAKIDVSALKASLEHAKAAYKLAHDLCERRRRL